MIELGFCLMSPGQLREVIITFLEKSMELFVTVIESGTDWQTIWFQLRSMFMCSDVHYSVLVICYLFSFS
jgi:hypothetical protein